MFGKLSASQSERPVMETDEQIAEPTRPLSVRLARSIAREHRQAPMASVRHCAYGPEYRRKREPSGARAAGESQRAGRRTKGHSRNEHCKWTRPALPEWR